MVPFILLAALTCNIPAADAKFAQATTLETESRRLYAEIDFLTQDRAARLEMIAREKANPSGVADLALLHELGVEVQDDEFSIARDKKAYLIGQAQEKKLLAEIRVLIAGCKKN